MSGTARVPLRVVILGAECTGKTVLTEWLARALGYPASAEYAREYAEARGGSSGLTAADVESIARGQLALEEEAIGRGAAIGSAVVLHDTDLLSTAVYARYYYGADAVPAWLPEAVRTRHADLYLLCDIEVPWDDDRVRDAAQDRAAMQRAFREALVREEVRVVEVSGDRGSRQERARGAIERLVGGWPAGPAGGRS